MSVRILIIEDDKQIADFLIRGLREEGYVSELSTNGEDAWFQLKNQEWDLVILDWWLPGSDGLNLLKRFRQLKKRTPVLFLTARDSVEDKVRGLDAGADDYLAKPFSFEELLARIRVILRREQLDQPINELVYDDLRIDLASQRVERSGQRLDLSAREYSLLVFFLRHIGQVLSRTRIYEHVWDERYDGLSNTLEVHVMELRRKLEQKGARLIHTLRNRGYLFGQDPSVEDPASAGDD